MLLVYVLCLAITTSMASDLCRFLDSGRIGLYRKFIKNGAEVMDKYLTFGFNSPQMWEIRVESDDREGIKIRIGDLSAEVNELNITNKFDYISSDGMIWNCSIREEMFLGFEERKTHCSNQTKKLSSDWIGIDPIVFNPIPNNRSLAVGQRASSAYWLFTFPLTDRAFKDSERCDDYYCPKFVKEMESSLSQQSQDIVAFNTSGVSGHLMLFNISGQLKYCYQTFKSEDKSKTCNSIDDLKPFGPFGPECDPKEESGPSLWWIPILVVSILIVVIAGIAGYWLYIKGRRNGSNYATFANVPDEPQIILSLNVTQQTLDNQNPDGTTDKFKYSKDPKTGDPDVKRSVVKTPEDQKEESIPIDPIVKEVMEDLIQKVEKMEEDEKNLGHQSEQPGRGPDPANVNDFHLVFDTIAHSVSLWKRDGTVEVVDYERDPKTRKWEIRRWSIAKKRDGRYIEAEPKPADPIAWETMTEIIQKVQMLKTNVDFDLKYPPHRRERHRSDPSNQNSSDKSRVMKKIETDLDLVNKDLKKPE